ncbi:hypothetical protein [Phreatobacter sp. AB_2022a]|uniref:hypothetical protein n=1 Tax=Phreatobacter sp. AB_2022a TaxID=3003134 RepID=UPI002286DC1A|nr:hypothetical protein [Phreatobacter sp. AB_2022a]MCZ0738452.1 hypothetical protein [Phreatobacter sp. AB_2022a]
MTPLERLILGLCFDEETDATGLVYFHSWCGPSQIVTLPVDELRAASEASVAVGDSTIGAQARTLLARHDAGSDGGDPPDEIDIDLTEADGGWERILQDIVRRSPTLEEIVATSAWTCSRMRPDGWGGAIMRITTDAIQYRSTSDMLEDMREQPHPPDTEDDDGLETRRHLEATAAAAGWDSFTLLLLIARWLSEHQHAGALIEHLDRLVGADGG